MALRKLCFALLSGSATLAAPIASNSTPSLMPYSLPGDGTMYSRAQAIEIKRQTFTYVEGTGGGPFSPNGTLGQAMIERDTAIVTSELLPQVALVTQDLQEGLASAEEYNGLKTLDDYTKIYQNGHWSKSTAGIGIDAGMLTNYTQDLLFSMERLAFGPFMIRRLDSDTDKLPFTIDDDLAKSIANATLQHLLEQGRLFYADYQDMAAYEKTKGKYGPACDALFYISDYESFLPVAIRTIPGSDLIYTPKDSAEDWLLAKIMFNVNDFLRHGLGHLGNTHYVAEIIYESAIRTLSDDHPVIAMLARLNYGEFAIRPFAVSVLLRNGGVIDNYSPWTGAALQNMTADLYFDGTGGSITDNYFYQNLKKRGLIQPKKGPELKYFPFFEDGSAIFDAQRNFMKAFVESYYSDDAAIQKDSELQAWNKEATGPAQAIDFPTLDTRDALIDLLAHAAMLVSIKHHTVNLNQVVVSASVLPFNPPALYKPVPTAKGVTDIVSFLPPLNQSQEFIQVGANFAKPLLIGTNRTLAHMFDDKEMLGRMNKQVQAANDVFKTTMMEQSKVVSGRTFDAAGLSQGLPFMWKALDPNVIPWSVSI